MSFQITKEVIQVETVLEQVRHANAGATVLFVGTVRELTNNQKTLYLVYEAYESMAVKTLREIGNEIIKRWPGTQVAVTHRIGQVNASEVAIVIAVSSPHRADAYEANRYAIEKIKELVPIWKKDYQESREEWVRNSIKIVRSSKENEDD